MQHLREYRLYGDACISITSWICYLFFFFKTTPPTQIYTLSLHDALPIFETSAPELSDDRFKLGEQFFYDLQCLSCQDRKSTRLNSSHGYISYAVFCLKKKKTIFSTSPFGCFLLFRDIKSFIVGCADLFLQ